MNFDNIDKKEYQKQLKYFNDYYGSPFKYGQGTEELLELINIYSNPGAIIDFGSGSNIYFWLIAFDKIKEALCIDISKESFLVNEQIKSKKLYPVSCNYALKKYKKDFDEILKTKVNYLIFDVFKENLNFNLKFDNVTQFGLLGLCKNKEEYISNLNKMLGLLKDDGVLLGANWVFSKSYSQKMGFDNLYLSEDLIIEFSKTYNCQIQYVRLVPINDDNNYDFVLIYSIKNA